MTKASRPGAERPPLCDVDPARGRHIEDGEKAADWKAELRLRLFF